MHIVLVCCILSIVFYCFASAANLIVTNIAATDCATAVYVMHRNASHAKVACHHNAFLVAMDCLILSSIWMGAGEVEGASGSQNSNINAAPASAN